METPRLRNRLWRRRTERVWGISGERCQACFGVEYYSDLNQVKYHGCFFHDMHFGMGVWIIERDLSSIMDWKRDRPYSGQYDHCAVDNHTKEVIIPNNSLNETCSFILPSFLHSLKQIVIGNDCFGRVRLFLLDGLDQLEKIEIRTKSFTLSKDYQDAYYSTRRDGSCRIRNCP